ncbi:MAG: transketolase C-terminal domain-containing protein [Patescibacteria group bacterium]|nr:transketolase C-terminal domain-containing protein [Patescibacteria group bacterium]
MRNTVVEYIIGEARKNQDIILITADLGYSVVEKFKMEFPDRFFNIGIAEQNMIGVAAGLALSGKKVFLYSIAPFAIMRCFEQIRVDLCYQNLDVTILGVGGGFAYGTSGTTHNAVEDLAIMRALPNMKVMCPADPNEAVQVIKKAVITGGPSYIRLNRGGEKNVISNLDYESIKLGDLVEIYKNKKNGGVAIFSCGSILSEAYRAASDLVERGENVALYSCPFLKPINREKIVDILRNRHSVITVEEHTILGGLGSTMAEIIAEENLNIKLVRLGVEDKYFNFIGTQDYMRDQAGLSAQKIEQKIIPLCLN